MANFDIMNAASFAYRTVWVERSYLARLAIAPFIIKIVCYTAAFSAGIGDNYLRLTLFLIPANFAEGWMLAHFIRLLVFKQRWPFVPSGNPEIDRLVIADRARGVIGGVIAFVLINMALGGLLAAVNAIFPLQSLEAGAEQGAVDPMLAWLSFVFLIVGFWAFRLVWLYIPMALNMSVKDYLYKLRGFSSSLSLIGVWILCFIPFFLLMQVATAIVLSAAMGTGASEVGQVGQFLIILLTVAIDTVKNLFCTAGILFGLREIYLKLAKSA